jgi:hypothetical protein
MYMSACMHVYIYIYIYMYVCMYAVFIYVRMFAYKISLAAIYSGIVIICTHIHPCMHKYIRKKRLTQLLLLLYIHTYIYIIM